MSTKTKIESLLFISAKPIGTKEMAQLIKKDTKELQAAADELMADYNEKKGGLQIIKNGSSYQMVSAPENSSLIQDFIKDETAGELTRPSMETLTIIAYRGPIAKLELERIRGVNCSLIIRNLLIRGLIEAKPDKKKNETYYSVTFDFIRFLGINDIKDLPNYEKLSKDDTLDKILKEDKGINNL
jgi:segregation and condensation protein B